MNSRARFSFALAYKVIYEINAKSAFINLKLELSAFGACAHL